MTSIVQKELLAVANELANGKNFESENLEYLTMLRANETCMSEYGAYVISCGLNKNTCETKECANAIEVFKCCLKTTKSGSGDNKYFSATSASPNDIRWNSMKYHEYWSNLRRNLILRTENCIVNKNPSSLFCVIQDDDPKLNKLNSNNISVIPD